MNKIIRKQGFTLIEILIATAIFATVMIIVVATFSWAAGYNNRLKETRRVGQEVRSAMDQITSNIRLANGSGKVAIGSTTYDIGEITLMLCTTSSNSSCTIVYQNQAGRYKSDLAATTDPEATNPISNAILILKANSKEAILYRSALVSNNNYKFTAATKGNISNFNNLSLTGDFPANSTASIQPVEMSMQVYFGGYCGKKLTRTQQPYAEIYMIGKTLNYDKLQPIARSRFHLKTTIETRDYDI